MIADLSPGVWVVLGSAPSGDSTGAPADAAGAVVVPVVVGSGVAPGAPRTLSRSAVWLEGRHDGAVRVVAAQRHGTVLLDRHRWGQEASLPFGGEHVLRSGVFTVELVNGGSLAKFAVTTGLGDVRPPGVDGQIDGTAPRWSRRDVFNPAVPARTVAALCVLACGWPGPVQSIGSAELVGHMVDDLLGLKKSDGFLTRRLDQALADLGVVVFPGQDTVPTIAEQMLRGGVLEDAVYVELGQLLEQRRREGARAVAERARAEHGRTARVRPAPPQSPPFGGAQR